jgi:LmbE family N-acetylglucosaminyl deacetylase
MNFRRLSLTLLTSLTALAVAPAPAAPPLVVTPLVPSALAAQTTGSAYQGATAAGLELRRLGMTGRVLHIAAHPDDENTALLAALALGQGADVAYLSLTRGEGGQNSIGPELSAGLGVVRSGELVAARRLDGATQFFARAIDYGYSKSADEAFRRWPADELLSDVVEVIRRYRPDVVVSVWSGTDLDGHGQHEASGIVARQAVLAAGDPTRFPEQIAAGLRPHAPRLYYRSAWFSERPPDVELNTGVLDPLLGQSHHQVAMASRGLHRSQDQGRPLEPGPRRTSFHRIDPASDEPVAADRVFGRYSDGAPRTERSLFEGVDTLLSQRAVRLGRVASGNGGHSGSGPDLPELVDTLRRYEALAATARREYSALEPWRLLPTLYSAQSRLLEAASLVENGLTGVDAADHAALDLHAHLTAELGDVRDALLSAANVQVEATADQEWVVPGQTFRLELGIWNGGPSRVRVRARPYLPQGWDARAVDEAGDRAGDPDGELDVAPGDRLVRQFVVTVAPDAGYTMPYFLDPTDPVDAAMYWWPDDPDVRGLPFAPDPVRGAFLLRLDDAAPIHVDREAVRVGLDRRAGEFRRPVRVVPAATVAMTPDLTVIPTDRAREPRELTVRVRRHAPDPVAGELRLDLPAGWAAEPRRIPVRLDDGEHAFTFVVTPSADVAAGEHRVRALLATDRGDFTLGFHVIDYPHVEPRHLYARAEARVRVLDVEVAPVRVGFVEGTGDGVPEALDRLGVDWTALGPADLATGDLDRFHVIITGIRAYELRDDLVEHNRRLLEWTRRGGTLIVQYNQYAALQRDYAPWPVTIARPHGRVTDENAPVRILEPDHPVVTTPNAIGTADWEGWVQERGLYFLDSWDGPLTPLLAMSDPGEDPLTGALLVAPLGEGTWVYSGLALFRQLPEGVPGAYRLLANLISLGGRR